MVRRSWGDTCDFHEVCLYRVLAPVSPFLVIRRPSLLRVQGMHLSQGSFFNRTSFWEERWWGKVRMIFLLLPFFKNSFNLRSFICQGIRFRGGASCMPSALSPPLRWRFSKEHNKCTICIVWFIPQSSLSWVLGVQQGTDQTSFCCHGTYLQAGGKLWQTKI